MIDHASKIRQSSPTDKVYQATDKVSDRIYSTIEYEKNCLKQTYGHQKFQNGIYYPDLLLWRLDLFEHRLGEIFVCLKS